MQNKSAKKNAPFVEDALKTRGIIYLNVETSSLFAPPIKISGYVPGSMDIWSCICQSPVPESAHVEDMQCEM